MPARKTAVRMALEHGPAIELQPEATGTPNVCAYSPWTAIAGKSHGQTHGMGEFYPISSPWRWSFADVSARLWSYRQSPELKERPASARLLKQVSCPTDTQMGCLHRCPTAGLPRATEAVPYPKPIYETSSRKNIRKERRSLRESLLYRRNGSSGRTRTYNPPVNSRGTYAGLHVLSMT